MPDVKWAWGMSGEEWGTDLAGATPLPTSSICLMHLGVATSAAAANVWINKTARATDRTAVS